MPDVSTCLAEAAGLSIASSADVGRYDVVAPAGLFVTDAVRLARKVAGLEPNP